jgi:hypothetical protein
MRVAEKLDWKGLTDTSNMSIEMGLLFTVYFQHIDLVVTTSALSFLRSFTKAVQFLQVFTQPSNTLLPCANLRTKVLDQMYRAYTSPQS